MNLSALFIARPVATTLLTIGLALAGAGAFLKLPVSPLPKVDYPTIQVSASLPGASPETVASSLTTPLERALGAIAGVTEMTSQSTVGNSRITLQFDLSRSIDGAARDVQAAINAARMDMPGDLPSNPQYRKLNPADAPVLVLALTSDTLGQGRLYDAASNILQQKLSQVNGVGQVVLGGSSLPAVRIEINPTSLSKYGVGLESVRAAIAAANANSPKGALEVGDRRYQLYSNDQARTVDEYRPLIIAWRNGSPVRLSDVAEVIDATENIRNEGQANGKRSVLVIIYLQPNANVIETVDQIKALLPELQAALPNDVDVQTVADRTTTIRASLREVEHALMASIILVVLVTFAFLRSVRAGFVASVVVPVSLIGTFGGMYLLGFSINNLSLMAMAIAAGFVVDDAIIVLENISRHIEAGMSRVEAALQGAREVGFTVVSMSLSLIAVFIPILLMGGIVGRLFREFAVTLTIAILISMVVSLTTTPMLCAYVLRPHGTRAPGWFFRASERGFNALQSFYGRSLGVVLRHPLATMFVFLATVLLNVYLYVTIPKGFFPQQDTGRIIAGIRADQSISFQAMRQKFRQFMRIVREDPDIASVAGFTGGYSTNSGFMFATLKPLGERTAVGRPGDRAPASEAFRGGRRAAFHAGGAGHPGRRPPGQFAVPVQPAGRCAARTLHLGPETAGGLAQGYIGHHRCRLGPGAERSAGQPRDRPRCRGPARRQHAQHLIHALRRLRPAPGLDHLQRAEPVPYRHGGLARVLGESRIAEGHLCQHDRRRDQRRPGDRRHRVDGAACGGCRRSCGGGAQPAHQPDRRQRPRHGIDGGGRQHRAGNDDPAAVGDALRFRHDAACRQSSGPVRRQHDLVQPGAGQDAERRRRLCERNHARNRPAVDHPRLLPGHG